MLDKPNSPLRRRMIEDMTARRFKEKVQKDYVRHVRRFAAFLGRSPDAATSEDLRRFQLHLATQPTGTPTINSAIAALRYFFNVTLERPDLARHLTTVHKPRKAPVVLIAVARRQCASLSGKHVTPHVLRRTLAMDLLHHGVDRSVIALWLGHESVETTSIYLHADMQPISRVTPPASRSPTRGLSPSTRRPSRSDGRTIGSKGATGSRP